jgi:hypothetical protein
MPSPFLPKLAIVGLDRFAGVEALQGQLFEIVHCGLLRANQTLNVGFDCNPRIGRSFAKPGLEFGP